MSQNPGARLFSSQPHFLGFNSNTFFGSSCLTATSSIQKVATILGVSITFCIWRTLRLLRTQTVKWSPNGSGSNSKLRTKSYGNRTTLLTRAFYRTKSRKFFRSLVCFREMWLTTVYVKHEAVGLIYCVLRVNEHGRLLCLYRHLLQLIRWKKPNVKN